MSALSVELLVAAKGMIVNQKLPAIIMPYPSILPEKR
jgi:hypothetical protein